MYITIMYVHMYVHIHMCNARFVTYPADELYLNATPSISYQEYYRIYYWIHAAASPAGFTQGTLNLGAAGPGDFMQYTSTPAAASPGDLYSVHLDSCKHPSRQGILKMNESWVAVTCATGSLTLCVSLHIYSWECSCCCKSL